MKVCYVKKLLFLFVAVLLFFCCTLHTSVFAVSTIETETAHFVIRYQPGCEAYFQEMTELAESIYKDTTTFVGYTPAEKVKVTLQSTDKTFAFGGFAGGGTVLKYGCPFSSESAGKDYLDRKRQISHEFTHYLLFQKIPAMADPVVAMQYVWISEGVAMYASDTGINEVRSRAAVAYLVETGELPSSLKNIYGKRWLACFLSRWKIHTVCF